MDRRPFGFRGRACLREAPRVARHSGGAGRALPVARGLSVRASRTALLGRDRTVPSFARSMKWTFLVLVAVLALITSVVLGPAAVPLGELLHSDIVWNLRAPRALLAFLVGGSLGVAGAGLQALVRNPLADPFLLGLSGGAGLGAVLAIALHLSGPWALPIAAFIGALAALGLVYRLGLIGGASLDPRILLLGGVAIGAFAAAITTAIVSLAVAASRPLDLLALGEESAGYLGADVEAVKRRVYLAASLLTAAAVAVSGVIGFVGLVVPHLARPTWGHRHRALLPAAFLGGGTLLAFADTLARTVVAPRELPVGVVTALIGVPVFAFLLRRWTIA